MSYGYTLLAESFPVAQKRHRCIWCGEDILPGEKYRRERSVYDGNMQNFAWHPECDDAFKAELEAGGECEFSAYDNDRPSEAIPDSYVGCFVEQMPAPAPSPATTRDQQEKQHG